MASLDYAIVHRLVLGQLLTAQGDELAPVMDVTDAGFTPRALQPGLPRATLVSLKLDHQPRARTADADVAAVTVTVGVELEREPATTSSSPAASLYGISTALGLVKAALNKAGLYDADTGTSVALDECQASLDPVRADDGNRRSGVVTVTGVACL